MRGIATDSPAATDLNTDLRVVITGGVGGVGGGGGGDVTFAPDDGIVTVAPGNVGVTFAPSDDIVTVAPCSSDVTFASGA